MFSWRRTAPRRRRGDEHEPSIKRHILYGVLACIAVTLLCTALWYLTRLSSVTISEVVIEGGETISHDMVRGIIEQELTGAYLLLVPRRFAYTYPEEDIYRAVSDIARIHSVVVVRTSGTSLAVSFSEYIPHTLWCLSSDDSAPCYFVSREGYAFAPAPNLRGGALVRHIIEGKTELAQQQIFDTAALARAALFTERLEQELGLRVREVIHTEDQDERYELGGGGAIFIATDSDIEKAFDNLHSIFASKEFSTLEPGNFNYIDLRFGNKIFVNDQMDVATTTSDSGASGTTTLPE